MVMVTSRKKGGQWAQERVGEYGNQQKNKNGSGIV